VSDRERLIKAANDAEKISQQLHEAAEAIFRDVDPICYSSNVTDAYARLYHIRTDLGRVVASLGVGVPRRH
jgi:hypothetical protein